MKDHRSGLLADFEDGHNRTFVTIEPGPPGKQRLAIEAWDFLRQESPYRATTSAAVACEMARAILRAFKDTE